MVYVIQKPCGYAPLSFPMENNARRMPLGIANPNAKPKKKELSARALGSSSLAAAVSPTPRIHGDAASQEAIEEAAVLRTQSWAPSPHLSPGAEGCAHSRLPPRSHASTGRPSSRAEPSRPWSRPGGRPWGALRGPSRCRRPTSRGTLESTTRSSSGAPPQT